MIHRKALPVVFALAIALIGFQPLAFADLAVKVVTDPPEALYHVGESATFLVTVEKDGTPVKEGEVTYVFRSDAWKWMDSGKLALSAGSVSVKGKLDHPGFLRCMATYKDAEGKEHSATAGAGFDPAKIKPSMAPPEDFDAFWADKKKALAEVPMNPRLTPVKSGVDGVECFDVQLDCLGDAPVSGYYVRPVNAKPKSLPAVLWTHGAGVGSSSIRAKEAAEGMIILDINAHGLPNGKPSDFYKKLKEGKLKGYPHFGREDRETCYFLGMYLRLMRGMDFLTAQPEWDGKVLISRGSSQGGGQALVAAGLEPRVTLLIANVPAMCDHTGVVNGWPRLVPRDGEDKPDAKVQQVARYFDAMNFATRTSADALVSVGFIDNTCRPTSVYSAFNNLSGKKQMLHKPLMTHAFPPEWGGLTLKTMLNHIQEKKGAVAAAAK